jgi:dTDP-4-amino-4,6-dideoxygalactose transaminase
MGLSVLKSIDDIQSKRREQSLYYKEKLDNLPVTFQKIFENTGYNYAYFPVVFENEAMCLKVISELNLNNIMPRRYFYPSLSKLNYVQNQSSPISEDISSRILCLPLFHDLSHEEIDMICRLVKRAERY